MSIYINGVDTSIPVAFASIPELADIDASLDAGTQPIGEFLHPELARAIRNFRAGRTIPRSVTAMTSIFGPAGFWIDKRPGLGWERLDKIAKEIVTENPRALNGLEQVLEAGYIAEMKIAMEFAIAPDSLDAAKRNEALLRLRDLELKFADYRIDPKTLSAEEKMGQVQDYLEASRPFIDFGTPDDPLLNTLFDLVQLHEFLNREAGILANFEGRFTPALVTDLLCGDLGSAPIEGPCHPMAVLAAHLGHKMELPLNSFFSEKHVSLFVDIGDGFLYEPTAIKMIFGPKEMYSIYLLAPENEQPKGSDLLVLSLPWEEVVLMSDANRSIAYLSFLAEHADPSLWVHWNLLATALGQIGEYEKADRAAQIGLKIFPDSMPLLFLRLQILVRLNREEEAREVFRRLHQVFARRLDIGFLGTPTERYRQRLAGYAQLLGEES